MIQFITDKTSWDLCISQMDSYDFYHTFDYHENLKKQNEEPILIFYQSDSVKIAVPFLKRPINSKYHDLISVHGYLGPVSKNIDESFNNEDFNQKLNSLLQQENIVSVFSKLNPFIDGQRKILKNIGDINRIGEVIFFNQKMDSEEQIKCYNRNTRQKIKQLKKICTVKFAETDNEIKSFIALYHKGMDRLKAKDFFYFKKEYFKTLLQSKLINADILLAIHNETNDIMGGVFCVTSKNISHIELAFTNEPYFKNSPVRILFDFCRNYYKNGQIAFLNLGGGSGGREGSLMKFKATFTNHFIDFHVWKLIVIPQEYENLTNDLQRKSNSDFFPKYRLQV